MATETSNLGLTLPDKSEYYSLDVWNENMEKIDEAVKSVSDAVDAINDTESVALSTSYGGAITFRRVGNVVSVYGDINGLSTVTSASLGTVKESLKPNYSYAVVNFYRGANPFEVIGSVWISENGGVTIYKPSTVNNGYIYGTYLIMPK